MSAVPCDWPECNADVAWECRCRRCASEPEPVERFHSCADREHLIFASAQHARIRERGAEWLAVVPDEWDIRLGVTALGGVVTIWAKNAPDSAKQIVAMLAPALAWLYPGPGEAKALRELAELRAAVAARDACVVCGDLLLPDDWEPHCEGCDVDGPRYTDEDGES
jgi:hypothetical protein